MPGKSGRRLIFWGRVPYAHSTICSKLSGSVVSAIWPTVPPGHAARRGVCPLGKSGEGLWPRCGESKRLPNCQNRRKLPKLETVEGFAQKANLTTDEHGFTNLKDLQI